MNGDKDAAAIEILSRALEKPDPFHTLLRPEEPSILSEWPAAQVLQYVRLRVDLSQDELAVRAGVPQSQVSRLEAGADCRLSTWARVYEALGFTLRLVPVTKLDERGLRERANGLRWRSCSYRALRPHGPWFEERRKEEPPSGMLPNGG